MSPRSWLEISISRIVHNLSMIRSRLAADVGVMPVLKANAYGHGTGQMARILDQQGISAFAVAHLSEALEVRSCAPRSEILVLGGCLEQETEIFLESGFTAAQIDDRPPHPNLAVEVKVDTGMNRLGISWERAASFLDSSPLNIRGAFSHFSRAETDPEFTRLQLQRFLKATAGSQCRRHICNSAGLRFPEAHLDCVRVGLALYGVAPCPGFDELQPVTAWKSFIATVKRVQQGEWIGYGTSFQAQRKSTIGLVPVGYADGYSTRLANRSKIEVEGQLAPVIGSVNMDWIAVDLTDTMGVETGSEVEVMSSDSRSPLCCRALADLSGTIPHEVLARIGPRVHRTYRE